MRTTRESREALLAGLMDQRERLVKLQQRRKRSLETIKSELSADRKQLDKIDASIRNIQRELDRDHIAHEQITGE